MHNETDNPTTTTRLHVPVMVDEVLEYLQPQPGKLYLDATFGAGGHTRAILDAEPTCRVLALDWDSTSLETHGDPLIAQYGERFSYIWGSFAHVYKLLKKYKIAQVDGVLADFGTSQMQIWERPGFSFNRDAPLDMRMSPSHQRITAAEILAQASEAELAKIFWDFGEERYSRRIAHAIVEQRQTEPLTTTRQLAALVKKVVPSPRTHKAIHPATRVFQALRIQVNGEIDNIRAFLPAAFQLLAPEGRMVCISFHSLEDREVKSFFRQWQQEERATVLTKKVVTPSDEEVERNPSARSAKLRSVQKLV